MSGYNNEEILSYQLGKTLQSIKNLMFREFKLKDNNITSEQWAVMSYLHKQDGLYQKQIADFLFKDKPTLTRILDVLEKRNLIIRISDEKDRRKFKIYLTQDGKNVVAALLPIASKIEANLKQNLTSDDVQKLSQILDKIYKNSNV